MEFCNYLLLHLQHHRLPLDFLRHPTLRPGQRQRTDFQIVDFLHHPLPLQLRLLLVGDSDHPSRLMIKTETEIIVMECLKIKLSIYTIYLYSELMEWP